MTETTLVLMAVVLLASLKQNTLVQPLNLPRVSVQEFAEMATES